MKTRLPTASANSAIVSSPRPEPGYLYEIYRYERGPDEGGFRPQAERQVKLRLALEKIAALEELKAGEEDLNQEYQKIAEQYKMEADKIKELIPAAELEKDICVEKAINLVRDNANIKDAE